jgi:hypothetical protein
MNRDYIKEQEAIHKEWTRTEFAVKMVNEALEMAAKEADRWHFVDDAIRALKVEV